MTERPSLRSETAPQSWGERDEHATAPAMPSPPYDGRLDTPSPAGLTHLYQIVQRRAAAYPDVVALGAQEGLGWRTVTSRELLALTDRLAVELAARGVRAGDRVVLWLPNHWRTPVYHFALWKLGAVVVPFDREMNPEAGAQILSSLQPRCVIAGYGERPVWAHGRELTNWWEPGGRGTSNEHPSTSSGRAGATSNG